MVSRLDEDASGAVVPNTFIFLLYSLECLCATTRYVGSEMSQAGFCPEEKIAG